MSVALLSQAKNLSVALLSQALNLNYCLAAPDVLLTALNPMATLETSLEANYDGQTDRRKNRLIGARATALPKKHIESPHFLETPETLHVYSFSQFLL